MYFTLHYDFRDKSIDFITETTNKIKSELEGLYWVKPQSNFFIVKCSDNLLRKEILKNLTNYSNHHHNQFVFLMSPLINNGQFSGVAATDLWDHIKEITKKDYGW